MIRQPLSDTKRRDALLWSTWVGRMHSRNNVIVVDRRAYVSSSGKQWNAPDPDDGVRCLDIDSGSTIWFTPTSSDANEVAYINDMIFVGSDDGTLFAIDPADGRIVTTCSAAASFYARPLESEIDGRTIAVAISSLGEIYSFDFLSRQFQRVDTLPFKVRANPVSVGPGRFLAGTEDGAVIRVELTAYGVFWEELSRVPPHPASGPGDYKLQIKGISSLRVVGDRVIVTYSRDTYDRRPPVACFSVSTGLKLWDAGRVHSASKTENSEFGNCRITPEVWNNLILCTFSYNESVHAFSLDTGKWVWRVRLDDSYFQNWSSPVVDGDVLYVARVNGVLSAIDLVKRELISANSIEVFDTDRVERNAVDHEDHFWPEKPFATKDSGPYPRQVLLAGICASPIVNMGTILVGTVSGHLRCLRLSSLQYSRAT